MRFGVLGPLAVWTTDGRPVRIPERKVRLLLADLLLHNGTPVSVDRLAEDLWGDRQPGNPANTLQTKISQLRKVLDDPEPGARRLVGFESGAYVMRVDTDVDRFRELVASGDPAAALEIWRGDVLADLNNEPFTAPAVQRLTEERLTAYAQWAQRKLDRGDETDLLETLTALAKAHPLHEKIRALQLIALYRAGRQAEALDSYREIRDLLAGDLGLEPGPELVTLQQSILTHDPSLRTRPNLPEPLTPLLGRESAVRDIIDTIGKSRLVTLTGPGGVGKTRIAVEVANRLGGGPLVEFAGIAGEWVTERTAATLGIREDNGLITAIRARRHLLVMDNCESATEAIAELVATLLRAAPDLRILTTSQEPLGIAGETVWPVPPLDTDTAVELFVDRAGPRFSFENKETLAEICQRLDGIPLALELAAARARAIGAEDLLARLDDRFQLLTTNRGGPARHRTLRAAIDWSWDLLPAAERVALSRLAVFTDGWQADAAEAMGASLAELANLADRSLVTAGPRYRMLESVIAYAWEKLQNPEQTRQRHAEYYAGLAERLDPVLRTRDQRGALVRFDEESANLRHAFDTAVRQGDAELAHRLVRASSWYWFLRGRVGEARRSMRQALDLEQRAETRAWDVGFGVIAGECTDEAGFAAAREIEAAPARARALWFLGSVLTTMGDMAAAEPMTEQALAIFRETGDRWGLAAAINDRVTQRKSAGDFAAAEADAAESDRIFTSLGERWGLLQSSFVRGSFAEISGDYEKARKLHENGLRMAEELSLWPEISYQLSWLGRTALLTGDYAAAGELHERAMRIGAERGFTPAQRYAQTGLALGLRREGKLDEAERQLLEVLDWHREAGFEDASSLVLAELGFVAEQRGDVVAARRWQDEGFEIARKSGDQRAIALALEGLAGVEALAGDHRKAAELLTQAAAARESVGRPLPPAERFDVDRIAAAIGSV